MGRSSDEIMEEMEAMEAELSAAEREGAEQWELDGIENELDLLNEKWAEAVDRENGY